MLGWLCILAKHLGTHAKASLPCLLLPLHRILPFPQQLQKDNNPSKITNTLASLVKGEVLSPEKIRATTGGIVTPPTFPKSHYPSRFPYCNRLYALICFHICTIPLAFRRGAGLPLPLHRPSPFLQSLQKDNNPSLSTTSLPPLSKVRCCRPKEFGRLPEGLSLHQPFQNRTTPLAPPVAPILVVSTNLAKEHLSLTLLAPRCT